MTTLHLENEVENGDKVYGYASLYDLSNRQAHDTLINYFAKHKVNMENLHLNTSADDHYWVLGKLYKLLSNSLDSGNTLVVYDALSLSHSKIQTCNILCTFLDRNIAICFLKYGFTLDKVTTKDSLRLIGMLRTINNEYKHDELLHTIQNL